MTSFCVNFEGPRRDVPEQLAELDAQGIGLIDIVVVNVKPFAPEVGARLVGLEYRKAETSARIRAFGDVK